MGLVFICLFQTGGWHLRDLHRCTPGHKGRKWRAGSQTESRATCVCSGLATHLQSRGDKACGWPEISGCPMPGHIFRNLRSSLCVRLAVAVPGSASCSSPSHMTAPCRVCLWSHDLDARMRLCPVPEQPIGFHFLRARSGWQVLFIGKVTQNTEAGGASGILQSGLT